MRGISVHQAARRMGVSDQRVRALLQAGRLGGRKIGSVWIVEPTIVARSHGGRPLSASNAWGVLALLSGQNPLWLDPSVKSRIKRRIRSGDLVSTLRNCEPRSGIVRWRVLPGDLSKIATEGHIIASGLSVDRAELDVVGVGRELDGYIERHDLARIAKRFRPDQEPDRPNLILRVPSHTWISAFDEAPLAVVAADLLDHVDARVARAAERVLEGLRVGWTRSGRTSPSCSP